MTDPWQDDVRALIECFLGVHEHQISPAIRSFSITLQSYSSRAYEYVRQKFHGNFPHRKTIAKWHANVNFGQRSGITKDSLIRLREKASQMRDSGKSLLASLCFDEIAIRKHIQWRDADKRFLGFIDVGKRDQNGFWPIANHALVFLLTGVNEEFSIPVAYYFITALDAHEKKNCSLK